MLNNLKINNDRKKLLDSILKSSKEEEKEKSIKKFHHIIEKDKEFILNCYRKQPCYKDSMNELEKSSKGNFVYNRLVKNGLKNKSSFIKILLKSIAKVSQHKKKQPLKIPKLKYGYNVPEIDIVRKKKYEIEKRNKLKIDEKEKIKNLKHYSSVDNNILKKNALLSTGKNIIDNLDINYSSNKNMSRVNSGYSRLFSGITKNLDNISTKNKSLSPSLSTNSILTRKSNDNKIIEYNFPEEKIRKFNSILDKCKEEISHGNMLGGKFEKFTNIINDNLSLIKQKRNNKEDNNIQDQKIIEDKITNKQKYKLLELEKFNELKRKIDTKISDNYVYFNRKEYSEIVKDKKKEEEYDLYLEDINKINEKLEKKKIKEKEKLYEIENLLDDVYKKKKYLKNKINNYSYNRIIEKENEEYLKDNVVFDDEFFILDEKKPEEHKGTLIPKLLSKKEELAKNKNVNDNQK